jgi:hypothetical protein
MNISTKCHTKALLWHIAPYSLVGTNNVSEVITASIIRTPSAKYKDSHLHNRRREDLKYRHLKFT